MLSSWSISARIYAGFGIVLALLTGLAIFTFTSVTSLTETFGGYREAARDSLFLNAAATALDDARLARVVFALDHSDEAAATVRRNQMKVQDAARRAEDLFDSERETALATQLSGVEALSEDYLDAFGRQTGAVQAAQRIKKEYQQIGRQFYDLVNGMAETAHGNGDHELAYRLIALSQQVFRSRVRATMFFYTGDETQLQGSRERFAMAREEFDTVRSRLASTMFSAQIEPIEALLEALEAQVEEMGEVVTVEKRESDYLVSDIGPRMTEAFAALQTAVVDRQNTLGPAASAKMDATKANTLLIAGAALVVGLGLAWVIGRWIARAVQGMAASMNRMAEGDLDIAVTGDEQTHELGRMAAALKVFQRNGLEKRRLDAEAAEAAERERAAQKEREALQGRVSEVVEKASAGDFSHRVEARFAEETLNQFACMMNGLLETVSKGVDETVTVMAALARGDLNAAMTGRYSGAFAELQRNVNGTVEKLRATVHDIKASSDRIRTATGEIAQGAGDLSSRAENQAASLEEIAATMEQMSATVKKNAENAVNASGVSAEARARADKGGQVVAEAVTAMGRIEEGSGKIAEIVSVIDGFAFQTNLLALNAAVEAARAGEAGKGFAVVASEVRTLAQRSAEAARDIKGLIQDSSHQVSDGVRLVTETGEALKEIVEAIRQVSDTVTEISEASREQSSGVDEITAAITSMDEITQQNSALADESASAARGLGEQAETLERMMAFFTLAERGRGPAADWDADAEADTRAAAAAVAAE